MVGSGALVAISGVRLATTLSVIVVTTVCRVVVSTDLPLTCANTVAIDIVSSFAKE